MPKYIGRVEGLGVCPVCHALPNKPCITSNETALRNGLIKSWPHAARKPIGFRR